MPIKRVKTEFMRFADDECGATAVEYGLIVTVVSLSIVASVSLALDEIKAAFLYIAATLKSG